MTDAAPPPQAAWVTGGASGIGAAVAARLRASGRPVVVFDRVGPCDLECDVGDPAALESAVASAVQMRGTPYLVVTCAGIGHSGLLVDDQPEAIRRVLDVNLMGTWFMLRAAARLMIDAGVRGAMVAVSSISGTLADRSMSAYCVSKAAVDMLVRVAATEWGPHGIRVNAVGPGVTATPMLEHAAALPGWLDALTNRTALGRIGTADDVAQAVCGLLEMEWVTGQVVHADGGLALHSPIDSYGHAEELRNRAH